MARPIAMTAIQVTRRRCSTTRRTYPYPRTVPERGATVEFRAVTKRYADQTAVDALSFQVPAGKICILVGPSGSGKTTSLKMVNRLIEPTSGAILIDGHDVLQEDPVALRRRIGYVIQQVGLFPHQTVSENVATVPRLLGWPAARIEARVTELLARAADDFVAQFVGADRGLKRLELLTVGGADIDPSVIRERVDANAPVLAPEMSLRQALGLMLQHDAQLGVVVDGDRYLGVLTLAKIGKMIRS